MPPSRVPALIRGQTSAPIAVFRVATIAAISAVLLGLVMEHWLGTWVPSETTGRRGDLIGLLGSTLACTHAIANRRLGLTTARRWLLGASVAASGGAALVVLKATYLRLVWGNFPERMAEFTEATLNARGQDPEQVLRFVSFIRSSWQPGNQWMNDFLKIAVWATVSGTLLAAAIAGYRRLSRQPIAPGPAAG